MTVETYSFFFALLSLACVSFVVVVGLGALVLRATGGPAWLAGLRVDLGRGALWLAWVIAVVTTLGSLYYSEVQGYVPCKLCWFQRIAMYPLSVILGIAAFRRDVAVRVYVLPLAAIGAVVASYQTWLQAFPDRTSAFCTVDAPCTARYVWEFGFVSLPFMALSAFVAIMVALVVALPPAQEVEP